MYFSMYLSLCIYIYIYYYIFVWGFSLSLSHSSTVSQLFNLCLRTQTQDTLIRAILCANHRGSSTNERKRERERVRDVTASTTNKQYHVVLQFCTLLVSLFGYEHIEFDIFPGRYWRGKFEAVL